MGPNTTTTNDPLMKHSKKESNRFQQIINVMVRNIKSETEIGLACLSRSFHL